MKKIIGKKLLTIFICLFVISFFISSVSATEVPFEVVKTEIIAETIVPAGNDVVVINDKAYDPASFSPDGKNPDLPTKSPMEIYQGKIDPRVKVPVTGIKYKIEFWNVGAMGGEKGFVFKSNYNKAKLTISYVTGQAYKMVATGKSFGGFQAQEKKEVSTPNIDDLEFDLSFSGGPYGKFILNEKDKKAYLVGEVVAGKSVKLSSFGVNNHLIYEEKATLPITNGVFDKWMEILGQGGCGPNSPPLKDSGIRFNDYEGEVMVRPDCDEDAWYGAELDAVLNVDDHIRTGDDSFAALTLQDMTTFRMKPESEIILDSQSGKRTAIRLMMGRLRANVKEMMEHGTMTVEMSQAVAGIKGTIFIVEDTGSESTLKVIEGVVEFTSKKTGEVQMVGAGEMITATKKGLEKKQEFDITKENATWESSEAMIENVKNQNKSGNPLYFPAVIILIIISIGLIYLKKKE